MRAGYHFKPLPSDQGKTRKRTLDSDEDPEYLPTSPSRPKAAKSELPSSDDDSSDDEGDDESDVSPKAPAVCDYSAFAKEIVRTVMGDPLQNRKYPGDEKFSKLI